MLERKYERVPLSVDAIFMTSGEFLPKKIFHADTAYEITRVLGSRKYTPPTVGCVATVEYVVVVENRTKHIYYEADTNTWFSVKEIL